jgi:hypothetical protein
VCRPKKDGGLGVKDLRIMNISLLTKWRWRLLSVGGAIWKNVLFDRYGGGSRGFDWCSGSLPPNIASIWWKDLLSIGIVDGSDRLNDIFFKKIGNGTTTNFWHDIWVVTKCQSKYKNYRFHRDCSKSNERN